MTNVCFWVCAGAHPGSWSHQHSPHSRLNRHRSTRSGCKVLWSCSWWNLFLSPPAYRSESSRCGLNAKHSTTTTVVTMEGMVEVKVVRSLFNLDTEHRLKLLDISNLLQAELCLCFRFTVTEMQITGYKTYCSSSHPMHRHSQWPGCTRLSWVCSSHPCTMILMSHMWHLGERELAFQKDNRNSTQRLSQVQLTTILRTSFRGWLKLAPGCKLPGSEGSVIACSIDALQLPVLWNLPECHDPLSAVKEQITANMYERHLLFLTFLQSQLLHSDSGHFTFLDYIIIIKPCNLMLYYYWFCCIGVPLKRNSDAEDDT